MTSRRASLAASARMPGWEDFFVYLRACKKTADHYARRGKVPAGLFFGRRFRPENAPKGIFDEVWRDEARFFNTL